MERSPSAPSLPDRRNTRGIGLAGRRSALPATAEGRQSRFRDLLREAEDVAGGMSAEELAEGVAEVERLKAVLWIRLNGLPATRPIEPDRLLTAEEAAGRLGVTVGTVYRKAKNLPFRMKVGGSLRFSAHGIDTWIRNRRGR